MVFYYIGTFFGTGSESGFVAFRFAVLQYLQFIVNNIGICGKWKRQKNALAVSSLSGTVWVVDGVPVRHEHRYQASFTIEAALVLSIVFLTLAALIENGYILHDQVTGNMILEETLQKVRYGRENEEKTGFFEQEGEQVGNPRLWLGTYKLQIETGQGKVKGIASAGEWTSEIEMKTSQPAQFLRRYQAIWEMGKDLFEDGS